MSALKKKVCKIIKEAGLGETSPDLLNTNKHRSHSPEGFFVREALLDGLRVSYYSMYTLTEFVKTYRIHGKPTLNIKDNKRSELIFENDLDGENCRYAGYIGA